MVGDWDGDEERRMELEVMKERWWRKAWVDRKGALGLL